MDEAPEVPGPHRYLDHARVDAQALRGRYESAGYHEQGVADEPFASRSPVTAAGRR